jgi:hypothetical protein
MAATLHRHGRTLARGIPHKDRAMALPPKLLPLGLLALLAACTNPYDPGQRAAGGALIGAGTGATIGGLAGGGRGAAIGALAGGLGGAAIGAATTPTPPQYQAGYPPQGYGQTYAPPPQGYAPAQVGAQAYYPPPPGYAPAPYYQGPPPQAYQQPPPGSYWQPQPYIAPPDPYAYRY